MPLAPPSVTHLSSVLARGGLVCDCSWRAAACEKAPFDELGCLGLQCHTALGDELHWRKGGERALALTPDDRTLGTLARSPTGCAAGRSPDPQKPLEACPRSPPTRSLCRLPEATNNHARLPPNRSASVGGHPGVPNRSPPWAAPRREWIPSEKQIDGDHRVAARTPPRRQRREVMRELRADILTGLARRLGRRGSGEHGRAPECAEPVTPLGRAALRHERIASEK